MSIENKIQYAVEHYKKSELDGAFSNACIAVDATAKKNYPNIKNNNERFKQFLKDNMRVLCEYGLPGISATGISFSFKHISIKNSRESGGATIEEILYHIIRCEYLHESQLNTKISFVDETHIGDSEDCVFLPKKIVIGMLASVAHYLPQSKNKILSELREI